MRLLPNQLPVGAVDPRPNARRKIGRHRCLDCPRALQGRYHVADTDILDGPPGSVSEQHRRPYGDAVFVTLVLVRVLIAVQKAHLERRPARKAPGPRLHLILRPQLREYLMHSRERSLQLRARTAKPDHLGVGAPPPLVL